MAAPNRQSFPERRRILDQAMSARTLSAVANASRELEWWITEHPEDQGIVGAFDQLAMVEDALQGELESVSQVRPELVKQA